MLRPTIQHRTVQLRDTGRLAPPTEPTEWCGGRLSIPTQPTTIQYSQFPDTYYSIYRPRKDERLSLPSWLTCSGRLTLISGHRSAAGRAQDRERSPAKTDVLAVNRAVSLALKSDSIVPTANEERRFCNIVEHSQSRICDTTLHCHSWQSHANCVSRHYTGFYSKVSKITYL